MSTVHETAYPVLPAEVDDDELRKVYTPRAAEIRFVCCQFRQAPTRALILTQLKLLQRLGYMPPTSDVPPAIIDHVCAALGARPVPQATLARYDRSGSKSRHQRILREYAHICPLDASPHAWLASLAAGAAHTKAELPDIVNVLLEELVRHRYELPPLATLSRIAIQPDMVHGDTHAQSVPVFALAHLLGINLMPRIRDVKDLVFCKADRRRLHKNIESLLRASIDWTLIERHFPDMLRMAIAIKAGVMTPSTILRRLDSDSAKNKLYFAFRELESVVRTMFLLRYINDPEMRRTIHAAANKSEQLNDFAKWLMFGGNVIAENLRHEQRKVIKYNQLVANMVILYNVQWMSRKLKELQAKRHPVDADVLEALSPYRRDHINRLGSYLLDLQRRVPPLDLTIDFDFSFKSAA